MAAVAGGAGEGLPRAAGRAQGMEVVVVVGVDTGARGPGVPLWRASQVPSASWTTMWGLRPAGEAMGHGVGAGMEEEVAMELAAGVAATVVVAASVVAVAVVVGATVVGVVATVVVATAGELGVLCAIGVGIRGTTRPHAPVLVLAGVGRSVVLGGLGVTSCCDFRKCTTVRGMRLLVAARAHTSNAKRQGDGTLLMCSCAQHCSRGLANNRSVHCSAYKRSRPGQGWGSETPCGG